MQNIIDVFGPKIESEIQAMIFDTIKTGDIDQLDTKAGDQYVYIKKYLDINGEEQEFRVIVTDRPLSMGDKGPGNIITAFPNT